MKIAIAKERRPFENRVAATPETVKKFIAMDAAVVVEKGAGENINISDKDFTIEKGTRLCQIVGPGLEPIQMKLVTELENTDRGAGFGSSGK
jgi:alanine dehydrogenase